MATRRKPLTTKVRRGLVNWTAVMDLLLSMPNDSELQTMTEDELEEMRRATEWIDSVLAKRETTK